MDYSVFEQRVLDVLFQTTAPITPIHMAYYARIPVAQSEKHLERMVEEQILVKECDLETGAVTYVSPNRQLLAPPQHRPAAIVPTRPLYSRALAALLSLVLPGSGHIYSGRERAGVLWLFGTLAGYVCLVIPGLIMHVFCIASAVNVPRG
jgi:hypothetical protein